MKGFDKDQKQAGSSQFKSQNKGKKESKDVGQYTIPSGPKCFGCQGFEHMKQECLTYLKATRKSKALTATLSDIEVETESNVSDEEGIVSAFIATVDPFEGITKIVNDEEDLVESKFEKMNKMTSIQLMQNCTRFLKSMRNCIGWPSRS